MSDNVNMTFTPVPSVARIFTATPEHKFIFVLGPVGSTKTTSVAFFLMMKAAQQTPSPDGIRRSRFGIIRNTLVALKQTVLKDLMSLFSEIAEWRPSENVIRVRQADIDAEFILLPLETPNDQRRLLSMQLSAVWVNEAREVDYNLIMAAFSRCGRFPSMKHGKAACSHRFLIADSNMGVEGSELYKFLEEEYHPEVMYIHQPSALSPEADWLQYLPANYYDDLMVGAVREWIDTHVHAQWSQDLSGSPIFTSIYNEHFHVATEPLQVLPQFPLLVGTDPGLNPAALIGQYTARGQLRVLRECYAHNMLYGQFIDTIVTPICQMPGFLYKPLFWYMDPAGINRHATSGLSAKGMLDAKGFDVTLAPTNDIDPRLKAIELFLTETRGVETSIQYKSLSELKRQGPAPAIIIDPSCIVLQAGLGGKYRYKKKKVTGELEDKPEKKHPISDVMDSLGYLCMGVSGTGRFKRRATGATTSESGSWRPPDRRAWT